MEDVHEVSGETLASRLRARIDEAHGGNQRAFAHAMGLTPQHVYALLSGKITVPKPDVRRTLARELGLTHAELLVLTGELDAPCESVTVHRTWIESKWSVFDDGQVVPVIVGSSTPLRSHTYAKVSESLSGSWPAAVTVTSVSVSGALGDREHWVTVGGSFAITIGSEAYSEPSS